VNSVLQPQRNWIFGLTDAMLLVIRNNLADIVGSVSLRVTGPIDDPIVSGRITASRGTLNFRNDRYELSRAYIDLPASRGADPILNIQAESEIRGIRSSFR